MSRITRGITLILLVLVFAHIVEREHHRGEKAVENTAIPIGVIKCSHK